MKNIPLKKNSLLFVSLMMCAQVHSKSLLVKFKSGAEGLSTICAASNGGDVKESIPQIGITQLELPEKANTKKIIEELQSNQNIEYIEEDIPHTLATILAKESEQHKYDNHLLSPKISRKISFPPNEKQWGHNRVSGLFGLPFGDSGTIIALLDTGVYTLHQDLQDNILPGYNTIEESTDVEDIDGHGTHCAGILIGTKRHQDGVLGIAPHCKVLPIKTIQGKIGYTSWIASAIIKAADSGAKVISMSFSTNQYSKIEEEAIQYAAKKGCLLIAAAGNKNTDAPEYPAAFKEVLSVGATGKDDQKWNLSNYGPWVSVAAPGEDIYSTYPNGMKELSGTSMACPFVSGLAAILFSIGGNNIDAKKVREIIENSCDSLNQPWVQHGRINVDKAITLCCSEYLPQALIPAQRVSIERGSLAATPANSFRTNQKFLPRVGQKTLVKSTEEGFYTQTASQLVIFQTNPNVDQKNITFHLGLKANEAVNIEILIYNFSQEKFKNIYSKQYKNKNDNEQISITFNDTLKKKYQTISPEGEVRILIKATTSASKGLLYLFTTPKKNLATPFELEIYHSKLVVEPSAL